MMHWFEAVFGQGSTCRHQTTLHFFQLKCPPFVWLVQQGWQAAPCHLGQAFREAFPGGSRDLWGRDLPEDPNKWTWQKQDLRMKIPPKWLDQVHMVHKWLEKFDIIFLLVLCSDMSVFQGLLATWWWSGRSHGCVDWLEGRGFKIGCLLYHSYCWWFRNPAPHEVGSLSRLSHYL